LCEKKLLINNNLSEVFF